MLRVRDIMTADVVTLVPDQSLREAIETLVNCRIQGAPVLSGTKVVGVLSAPDILEFESLTQAPPAKEQSEDEPEEWQDGEEWSTTWFTDLWTNRGPDVVERMEATRSDWDMLADHQVSEAMSRVVCTLPANLEVSNAAQRMLEAGVQRALVMEAGQLVGILSTTDIIRAVAAHQLTVRQMVFEKR
jgi:CBS domain-containing protein